MPEMDGLHTVEQIKTRPGLAHIKILGISASKAGGPRRQAFVDACDDFVLRPFDEETLLEKIKTPLNRNGG